MERISRKQFTHRIEILQREGFDIGYDSQLGGVRVTNKSESRDFSVRGPASAGYEFLRGVETGAELERKRIKAKYPLLIASLQKLAQTAGTGEVHAQITAFLSDLPQI
jgi:hypothetical protein